MPENGKNGDLGYFLRESVRVFFSGDEEIRFRKGVWSYTEAILNLNGQDAKVKKFFNLVVDDLLKKGEADVQAIAEQVEATSKELQAYCKVLNNLKRQGYLDDSGEKSTGRIVNALLGGSTFGHEDHMSIDQPALFITDNEYAREAATMLAAQLKYPLDVLDKDIASEIVQLDLTTKTDAIDHIKNLEKYQSSFSSYSCVLGSFVKPNISLLRNLNRILITLEKPLILGLIDGPFMSLLSTMATQTGCFECYEQRILARQEDTTLYHKFMESHRNNQGLDGQADPTIFTPMVHMLTSAILSEGFIYSATGTSRLSSRVVNIYLPIFEIQVQDLLRVPYCSACGFISKAQMNEMSSSSRKMVDEMLEKIDFEN